MIVADTSVLAAFSGIRRLDIISVLFEQALVPKAVCRELVDEGIGWVEARDIQAALADGLWVTTVEVHPNVQAERFRSRLGAGELEVISLAGDRTLLAAIDDLDARRVAEQLGVKVIGSLGILGRAKRAGLIEEIRPLLFQMQKNGIRFGRSLVENFLEAHREI